MYVLAQYDNVLRPSLMPQTDCAEAALDRQSEGHGALPDWLHQRKWFHGLG
jgi:hypothetical protein